MYTPTTESYTYLDIHFLPDALPIYGATRFTEAALVDLNHVIACVIEALDETAVRGRGFTRAAVTVTLQHQRIALADDQMRRLEHLHNHRVAGHGDRNFLTIDRTVAVGGHRRGGDAATAVDVVAGGRARAASG